MTKRTRQMITKIPKTLQIQLESMLYLAEAGDVRARDLTSSERLTIAEAQGFQIDCWLVQQVKHEIKYDIVLDVGFDLLYKVGVIPRGRDERRRGIEKFLLQVLNNKGVVTLSRAAMRGDVFKIPPDIIIRAKKSNEKVAVKPIELLNMMMKADTALDGDSNDAEHDALFELREELSTFFEDPRRRFRL